MIISLTETLWNQVAQVVQRHILQVQVVSLQAQVANQHQAAKVVLLVQALLVAHQVALVAQQVPQLPNKEIENGCQYRYL